MGRAADSALAIVLTDDLISTRVASAKKRVLSDSSRVSRHEEEVRVSVASNKHLLGMHYLLFIFIPPCSLYVATGS